MLIHVALILQDQPERAVKLLAKMRQLKIQPDIRTYELLFSLFGNVNAPYEEGNILSQVDSIKRIKAIEMDMAKNGVQHSYLSMKNLVNTCPCILFSFSWTRTRTRTNLMYELPTWNFSAKSPWI